MQRQLVKEGGSGGRRHRRGRRVAVRPCRNCSSTGINQLSFLFDFRSFLCLFGAGVVLPALQDILLRLHVMATEGEDVACNRKGESVAGASSSGANGRKTSDTGGEVEVVARNGKLANCCINHIDLVVISLAFY